MVLLPLHSQPETRRRIVPVFSLRLADEARVHLFDLVVLAVTGAEHLFRGCGIPPELVRTQPLVWTVTVCPAGTDTMILRSLSMVRMASPEHSPSAGGRLGDLGVSFDELVQRDDLDGPGLSPAPGHGGISPPLGRRNGLGALRGNGAESELTTAGTS